MDAEEYRAFGKEAVDFIADYLENIRDRDVLPSVEPGYLHNLLPTEAPAQSEDWREVMKDMDRFIMPGLTHWQSPNFHAYYPTACSYPSIVGEILLNGLGVVGFSWIASPACTELEVIVMDWLGKFLGLPKHFLNCSPGTGGGVIQGSASESCLIALIAARENIVKRYKEEHPEMSESDVRGKLVAYSSDQSNSCVEKAGILGAVPMRLLQTDENCSLRGETLKEAIEKDIADGLIPCAVLATLGTTVTCAYDNLLEIGPLCEEYNMWLHIDAAYAGSAFCCPENRHLMAGVELADSFNFNLHKWMMVNFDCCAMWLKNADLLVKAFTVDRIYLNHRFQGESKAPDYRHWSMSLGRRMRSLKVWITLRTIGTDNIRENIRKHIRLAKMFEDLAREDDRFEILIKASLGVVVFRLKSGCQTTKQLLEKISEKKKIYMIAGTIRGSFGIRFVVCGLKPEESDILYAWNHILENLKEIEDEKKSIKPTLEVEYPKEKTIEAVAEQITNNLSLFSAPLQEKTK